MNNCTEMKCSDLKELKDRIAAGENPDDIIPYCINIKDPQEAEEFLFFASQVLKDKARIELCRDLLEEMSHAGR